MQISTTVDASSAHLRLDGRFDFRCQRDFRDAYETLLNQPGIEELVIDLGGVGYLDSSALGMLLLLRERAEATSRRVSLSGLGDTVREVLEIANFGALFTIRD